jgi:DNA-binding response OmpR family regulator
MIPHLLIADDDPLLCFMLKQYLDAEGFIVDTVQDGASALKHALAQDYDLITLDVMMPGMNGFEVLRGVRSFKHTPVLMLTAYAEDRDSIRGFELGADDYLAKPCDPRVLEAHIRAVLRRSRPRASGNREDDDRFITVGDLTINKATCSVFLKGHLVSLTKTEYHILSTLVRKAGQILVRSEISELVLGRPLGRFDRSLDMHVSNLRRKLGLLPDGRERIAAIRGVGYRYISA